jgi:hypothetical protein
VDRINNVVAILRSGPARLPELAIRKNKLLGDVVAATGADHLPLDILAGALLEASESDSDIQRMGWALRGAAFFSGAEQSAV